MPTDERWIRLERLLDAAVELPIEQRDALLDQECADEPVLRADAERLLRACEGSEQFLTAPLDDYVLPFLTSLPPLPDDALSPGEVVSRYEIVERTGIGGMGVVYKARDLRLDRLVALEFLPPRLGGDELARARLERESGLNSRRRS
jgi:eukaryotic-like serine/threonine-protein kinase